MVTLKESHGKAKERREEIQGSLESLFNECNELIRKENSSEIERYECEGHLGVVNDELKKYSESLAENEELEVAYQKFDGKVTEETLPFLKKKIVKDWEDFEKIWWKWSAEDIIFWWKFKIDKFKYKYGKEESEGFINKMKSQEISGKCLDTVDKGALESFGISSYPDRVAIVKLIGEMCSKYPKEKGDAVNSKEGVAGDSLGDNQGIPARFICPLTKKMMEDPVKAQIDGIVYERAAILAYLEELTYSESPKTKKKLPKSKRRKEVVNSLYPARKLKREIEEFKRSKATSKKGEAGDDGSYEV